MIEPMNDERLNALRSASPATDHMVTDLIREVDRLRGVAYGKNEVLGAAMRDARVRADRAEAALARVTDVERLHRAYLEAQLGRSMDDDEYADSRSTSEIGWLKSAIRATAEAGED